MNTISSQLEQAGENIEQRFDDDFEDIQSLMAEVKHLRQQAEDNSKQIAHQLMKIEHLERLVNPVPPTSIARIGSTDTVDYNNYKPQHPFFKHAAEKNTMKRKAWCWLTTSSSDKKSKAKQDKLARKWYEASAAGDEEKMEEAMKGLIAMARCKDKCKLGECSEEEDLRKWILAKLKTRDYHDNHSDSKSLLTRRRAKTALKEESSATSFQA